MTEPIESSHLRAAAAAAVEAGRALGSVEALAALRARLLDLLDRVTEAFPGAAADATLEQWRDARRLMFSAIQREADELAERQRRELPRALAARARAVGLFVTAGGPRPLAERLGAAVGAAVRAWREAR